MAKDFVFNFVNSISGVSCGDGGELVTANAVNFPALIGHGVAMTIGFIAPCGINLPHTHPRATEITFVTEGEFEVGFIQGNGANFTMNIVKKGMVTIFPQGSIHFAQNLNCEPGTFVAAFNPGVSTIGQNFIGGLPADIVGASLGGLNISSINDLAKYLPRNPALGTIECRKRCGLL